MAGLGRSCICVFPAKSRHTCTGHYVSPPISELSRWRKFSAPLESTLQCAQPRSSTRSGEEIVPAAEKVSALLACRDALLRVFFAPQPGPCRRIPPMPRWGQQFLLPEIYSMQRTHLLGEEMSKCRERTLRRFATAIEDGDGGEWTRRGRATVWTEWDETLVALVEWSEASHSAWRETRRLMIYTLHEERSERCIQAVKR